MKRKLKLKKQRIISKYLSNFKKRKYIIGRASESNIKIDDKIVSRKHAELNYSNGKLYLTDLGSANGTFINAQKVNNETKEINLGDRIVLGESKYSFKIEGIELLNRKYILFKIRI